jgi:hypothetical protein
MTMSLYQIRKNKKGENITLKGNKNPQEIFYESTQKLFRLLANHPYFLAGISKLRKKYKLPYTEITDIGKLLAWQQDNKEKRRKIISDTTLDELLADFKIPSEFRPATKHFACDFTMTNSLITSSMFDTGLNVIKPTEQKKLLLMNPSSVYLEITPHTTFREVKDRWNEIVEGRKEIRNYGIPATSKIEEQVWKLSVEGMTTQQIAEKLNKESGTRYIYNEVSAFKNRYKKALSKLKKVV